MGLVGPTRDRGASQPYRELHPDGSHGYVLSERHPHRDSPRKPKKHEVTDVVQPNDLDSEARGNRSRLDSDRESTQASRFNVERDWRRRGRALAGPGVAGAGRGS